MCLREEARFLADVVAAAPKGERILWGFDREIFSDRYLIGRVETKVPPSARASFARLKEASTNAFALQLRGGRAFHIIVLPGSGSHQAVLGAGRSFNAISSDEFDEFKAGDQRLTRVLSNANATGHEVIDLRALRPFAMRGLESWNADLVRTIHGDDAAVIWKGARAASG